MHKLQGLMWSIALMLVFAISFAVSEDNGTCGHTYTEAQGYLRFHRKSALVPDIGGVCSWTVAINGTNSTSDDEEPIAPTVNFIYLFADDFKLEDEDFVKVKTIGDKPMDILPPFKGTKAHFGILVQQTSVNVTLHTEAKKTVEREFEFLFSTAGCNQTVSVTETGTFTSPVYSTTDIKDSINCTFHFNPSSRDANSLLLHFPLFNLTTGYIVPNTDKHIDKDNLPGELIEESLDLEFFIEKADVFQQFTMVYELTSKACSKKITLSKDSPSHELSAPTASELKSLAMNCHWIVESDSNSIITVDFSDINLHVTDQLLVLDGANRNAPELARVSQSSAKELQDKYFTSTSNHLWISLSSEYVDQNLTATIKVTQKTAGGKLENNGSIATNGAKDFFYLLEVEAGQQVKFEVEKDSFPLKQGILSFYPTFSKSGMPFAKIDKNDKVNEVVAPGHQMLVMGSEFDKVNLKATFKGIAMGCYKYGSASGGTYSVAGNCNSHCAWTIPKSDNTNDTDDIILHFSTLELTAVDSMTISKLDSSKVASIQGIAHSLPDIVIPAKDGAILELERGNCSSDSVVVSASHFKQPACAEILSPKSGETVEILSPNHPEFYPLGAQCSWLIKKPSENALLHVTILDFELASVDHHLVVNYLNGSTEVLVNSFNGSLTMLPDDMLLKGDIKIVFNSMSKNTSVLKSESGFKISITVVDVGEILDTKIGSFSTPDFDKPVDKGTVLAWVVKVPEFNSTNVKNIISYTLENKTTIKPDELKKILTIYDGSSIRNLTTSNITENVALLSKTNTLIFVYRRGQEPSTPFRFNFVASACNASSMCHNGFCMHDDWFCNGVNNCGDWSDEINCEGTGPGPAPTPTPAPVPTTAGGTGTTALALGILAALLIGVLIGVGAPAALRRFRGNRFSSYSTFSNSPE